MNNNSNSTTKANYSFENIDWPVTLFLILTPLAALILTPIYYSSESIHWPLIIFAIVFAGLTNLSITAGYHRLFSHRSYEAHALVRAFYLLIGASAWQASALKWSADHRIHHSKVDTDKDPYSINKGFWYAHIGWLFIKDSTNQNPRAADLEKDWLIRFQHKYYIPLAILMGFGFPTLVGYFMGCPFGGFIIAGALRITVTQQSTFFVNSLCHTLGKQTYSTDVSARDSLLVAFLTHGEGYHNFHHHFQIDYRNGIRWYQWDPTKWTIQFLAIIGLASKLRRISQQEILKARLQAESMRIRSKGYSDDMVFQLKEKIMNAQISMRKLKEDYYRLRSEMQNSSNEKVSLLKIEMEIRKIEFQAAMKQWQVYLKGPAHI